MITKILKHFSSLTVHKHVPPVVSGLKGMPLSKTELYALGQSNYEQSKPIDYSSILPSDLGEKGQI